jgi:coenzyme F420-reducing hydrogenase gamma subunit
MRGLDVAFVEGAITNDADAKKLMQIRKNAKRLVAIGACAANGMPAAQRNTFPPELEGGDIVPAEEVQAGRQGKDG